MSTLRLAGEALDSAALPFSSSFSITGAGIYSGNKMGRVCTGIHICPNPQTVTSPCPEHI